MVFICVKTPFKTTVVAHKFGSSDFVRAGIIKSPLFSITFLRKPFYLSILYTMKSAPKIHVVGAGVVGLTTALVLQIKGYDVTILANHFPGDKSPDYTSPWAGARWKSVAPNFDARLQRKNEIFH